jgi:NAD(P)-dependent dehydrogenase (short-subunit alcohol dehydrogenase family)
MSKQPWIFDSLQEINDYRSPESTHQLRVLFGTESPVAWITGSAADRVGRAVARRFAMRGYRIVIHANRSLSEGKQIVEAWNAAGVETMMVHGPIEDEILVKKWIEQIYEGFGRLDVLVHAAAVWEPQPLELTTAKLVQEQFTANTLGTFLCAQHAGLAMSKQTTGGSIVLVGDWAVARPYRDFAAYFASKGSIPTLTRAFAVELGERSPNVRVNSVLPGPVKLVEGVSAATQEAILKQCLLHREGTADHVARAALFLAEHEFLTGVCLPVDGGRSIYAGSIADAIAHGSYIGT